MSHVDINGGRLFVREEGGGSPYVLVHGSWEDHRTWDLALPALAARGRVCAYDRRGHGGSGGRAPGTFEENVSDLGALVERIGQPAHIVATSYGAVIALGLLARRPELVRSIAAHEPPLFALLDGADEALGGAVRATLAEVVASLRAGDFEGGARRFVEGIATGPGTWARLPSDRRATFLDNAPTFVFDAAPLDALALPLPRLAPRADRLLLTQGERSPNALAAVVQRLERALPSAARRTFVGAGHVPHQSHPRAFCDEIIRFTAGF